MAENLNDFKRPVKDTEELDRLIELSDYTKQHAQVLSQINALTYCFKTKDLRPINDGSSYYVFALYKDYVIASTNNSKPEFVSKVSPNINKAINPKLAGYGPLLQIRFKESKAHGKYTKDIYEIEQDYQQQLQEQYQTINEHKQELGWMKEYDQELEWIAHRKEALTSRKQDQRDKEELEALEQHEQEYTANGLLGFIQEKRKREQRKQESIAKQKRQETLRRKNQAKEQQTQPIEQNNGEQQTHPINEDKQTQPIEPNNGEKQTKLSNGTKQEKQPIEPSNRTQAINELSLDFDISKPYITAPINAFSSVRANYETLLQAITRELNKNDTAFIDYTAGATNEHTLVPLSDRFCDNIILYYFLPEEDVANIPALAKWLARHKQEEEKEETGGRIIEALTQYLPENTQKLVRVFNTLDIPITKTNIKPTQPAVKDGKIAQMLKVALPDVPLDKVLRLVIVDNCLELLQANGFYINDIDITQDFTGLIDKAQVIRYLIETHDFHLQGDNAQADHTILDNSDKVGNNCLTFITSDDISTVRYKFYNKFVQSMESPSVRGGVGSHIADWVHNPEQILRNSIAKSLDTGILRLEITFYLNNQTLTKSYLMEHMDYLQNLLPPSLIYYQPIPKQWELFCSSITSNLCVVDLDNKAALLSYSINSLTSKTNGVFVSKTTTNKLSNILKLFTFNTPIILVLFIRNGESLCFQYKAFIKELIPDKKLQALPTYLTSGKKEFAIKTQEETQPQQMGLIDLPNVSLSYSPKLQVATKKTNKVPVVFSPVSYDLLQFPNCSRRRRLNNAAEEDSTIKLIQLHKQQLQAIKQNNEEQKQNTDFTDLLNRLQAEKQETIDKLTNINNVRDNKAKLLKLLNKPIGNVSTLTALEPSTKLYIYGVRYTNGRYGETVIMAANTEPNNSSLKLYWANTTAKQVIDTNKETWGFVAPNVILSATDKPLALLEIRDHYYNKSRNKCVSIVCIPIITTATNVIDEETIDGKATDLSEQLRQITAQQTKALNESPLLIRDQKLVAKESIDSMVKEGDVVSITACYSFRKSYIVQCSINNESLQCLKSNRFLDEILDKQTTKFSVMVGVRKLHPKSRRTCFSFLLE